MSRMNRQMGVSWLATCVEVVSFRKRRVRHLVPSQKSAKLDVDIA